MILSECRLLADENLHSQVIAALRTLGFDVLAAREEGWFGETDAALLHRASQSQRVIVTHDSDFGTLAIRTGAPTYGIIYLRPGHMKPDETMTLLQTLLAENLTITPPFIIIAQRSSSGVTIRLRNLSRPDREIDD